MDTYAQPINIQRQIAFGFGEFSLCRGIALVCCPFLIALPLTLPLIFKFGPSVLFWPPAWLIEPVRIWRFKIRLDLRLPAGPKIYTLDDLSPRSTELRPLEKNMQVKLNQALKEAVCFFHFDDIKMLINKGADPLFTLNDDGENALDEMAKSWMRHNDRDDIERQFHCAALLFKAQIFPNVSEVFAQSAHGKRSLLHQAD